MAISQVLYWLKPSFWLVWELSLDWLERIYRPLSCQAAVPFENNWTFYIVIGLALVIFVPKLGASFSVRSIFKVDPLRKFILEEVVVKTLILKVLVKPSKTVVKLLQLSNRLILVLKKASLLQSSDRPGSGKSTFDLGRRSTNTNNRSCVNQSIRLL